MISKPPSPASNAQTQQILLALTALRQHGPLAFASGMILAGIATAAVVWFWEPVYQAKAFLRVKQNPEYTQIMPDRNQARTDVKSELAPLTSELVLGRVLLSEEVRKQPTFRGTEVSVAELGKMIEYRSAGGPELFEVVATSQFPKEAQVLATVVTAQFLDYYQKELTDRIGQLQKELQSEMGTKSTEIANLNEQLNSMVARMQKGSSTQNSMFDPDGTYLTELRKSKIAIEVDLEILKQESQEFVASENSDVSADSAVNETVPVSSTLIRLQVESDPQMINIRNEIRSLQERRAVSSLKGSGHPESVKLDQQLKSAKEYATNLESRLNEFVLARLDAQVKTSTVQNQSNHQAETLREIENLKTRLQRLDDEIGRQGESIAANNKDRTEYENKLRDLQRVEQNYDKLRDASDSLRLKGLSVQYLIEQQNSQVALPVEPVERYPLKFIGVAALAGLAIPFGLAFLWELRIQRISNIQQLGLGMANLLVGEVASLPVIRSRSSKAVSRRMTKQLRLYQESVDNVSTMLFVDKEKIPSTLAITSAAGHEGKSTLSSQLALSIARSSHGRVLLIDCDLRSPSQHRLFDLDLDPGVAEILEQKMPWREVVKKFRVENLDILTAGRIKSSPRRCFSSSSWTDLLTEVQQDYDFVIVDTPPILATSESTIICKSCEATVMCTLRDFSRADSVRRAEERFRSADINVIGFVLAGVPQSEYANRYGTYGYVLN